MITVWLKIKMRSSLDSVLKCLNFWLAVFSDTSKYKVVIYNENVILPEEYKIYPIVSRQDLLNIPDCKKIHDQIQSNHIVPFWKPAAFALSAPYFVTKDTDLVYNIDADDIVIFGPIKTYLSKLEQVFNNSNIFTMSYDMHYSCHQGNYYHAKPHHWTFGVNLSRTEWMRNLILKQLFIPIPSPPWGINIDYMIDYKLDSIETPYICFITPNHLVHHVSGNFNHNKFTKFLKHANKVETKLYGAIQVVEKHKRTLLIE